MAGPPLGTQLGAMGINIAAFVKDFNLRTSVFREGVPLPTRTTVNADRSYNLTIHHPTSVYFLKQVGLELQKKAELDALVPAGGGGGERGTVSRQGGYRVHN